MGLQVPGRTSLRSVPSVRPRRQTPNPKFPFQRYSRGNILFLFRICWTCPLVRPDLLSSVPSLSVSGSGPQTTTSTVRTRVRGLTGVPYPDPETRRGPDGGPVPEEDWKSLDLLWVRSRGSAHPPSTRRRRRSRRSGCSREAGGPGRRITLSCLGKGESRSVPALPLRPHHPSPPTP